MEDEQIDLRTLGRLRQLWEQPGSLATAAKRFARASEEWINLTLAIGHKVIRADEATFAATNADLASPEVAQLVSKR